jgi:hypothetical protein
MDKRIIGFFCSFICFTGMLSAAEVVEQNITEQLEQACISGNRQKLTNLLDVDGRQRERGDRRTRRAYLICGLLNNFANTGSSKAFKIVLHVIFEGDLVAMLQNNRNRDCNTPLHYAAEAGHEAIVIEIIKRIPEGKRIAYIDKLNRHGQSAWHMSTYLQDQYPMTRRRNFKRKIMQSCICCFR